MHIFRCFIVYQYTNDYNKAYSIVMFAGIMVNKNSLTPVVSNRFLPWINLNQRLSLHQRQRQRSHLQLQLQLQFQLSLYRATRKKKHRFHLLHSPEHRLFLPQCHLQSAPIMISKWSILPTDVALLLAQRLCVQPPPPPVKCVAMIPTVCCQRTR